MSAKKKPKVSVVNECSLCVVQNENYSSKPTLLWEKFLGSQGFGMFILRRVISAFYDSKKLQSSGLCNNNVPAGCFLATVL